MIIYCIIFCKYFRWMVAVGQKILTSQETLSWLSDSSDQCAKYRGVWKGGFLDGESFRALARTFSPCRWINKVANFSSCVSLWTSQQSRRLSLCSPWRTRASSPRRPRRPPRRSPTTRPSRSSASPAASCGSQSRGRPAGRTHDRLLDGRKKEND